MSGQSEGEGKPRERTEAKLAEFFGRGEVFARQLITENERLRQEIADYDGEGNAPVIPAGVVEEMISRVADLERQLAEAEANAAKKVDDIVVQPSQIGADPAIVRELEARCVALTEEVASLGEGMGSLEGENYHLATLYIILQQLHAATALGDVVQTLTEVCLNFIGVGGFSLYVIDEERQLAFPLVREGASIDELEERPLADDGPLAAIAGLGRPWQGGDPVPHEYGVLMYLPLVSGERLVGVITLEAYLPQKSALTDSDFAVLAMLSEHGGIALEKVWIKAHATEARLTRRAIEALLFD